MVVKLDTFRPECSHKIEENEEAHLLRTNDWMETHYFLEDMKVQRFYLTLTGEVRSWYESLRPIVIDCTVYKISSDSNTQNEEIQENNYFMHGDYLIMIKM